MAVGFSDTVPEINGHRPLIFILSRRIGWDLHDQLLPLLALRESIRDAVLIWVTAGSAAWVCATAHIHEYPNMREYEYLRTPLQAEIRNTHGQDHKVLSYFLSDDRPGLEIKLSKVGQDLNMSSKDWDDRKQRLG